MLMCEYTYNVVAVENHIETTITETATGALKVFKHAYGDTSQQRIDAMCKHMDSLTDSLCSQWFTVRKPKTKVKASQHAR